MEPEAKTIVYFDGSCALCQAEMDHYRRQDRAGAVRFVDVSKPSAETPDGLDRKRAMARLHVRAPDGQIYSGAAAFPKIWRRLPGWRWAARAAALPGVLPLLELGYRIFLPVRPFLARVAARFLKGGATSASSAESDR